MLLFDTDVMVDILRGYSPALEWLQSLDDEEIALPGFVAMELLDGCSNKQEMNTLMDIIQPYKIHWPVESDCQRALNDFHEHHLSHNLGILDALIAECAVGLEVPLCTFNVKHYKVIPRLMAEKPYENTITVSGIDNSRLCLFKKFMS